MTTPTEFTSTRLGYHEVLRWNDNWTRQDHDLIAAVYTALADQFTGMWTIPSNNYVKAVNDRDELVFTINRGYVYFHARNVSVDEVAHLGKIMNFEQDTTGFYIPLSNHAPHDKGHNPPRDERFCPMCHMSLTPSGLCSNGCDDE